MTVSDCATLFRHAEWADALTWDRVIELGSEDRELTEKLFHAHSVIGAYLAVWRQEPIALPDLDTFASLRTICVWGRGLYADLRVYLEALPAEAAGGEVRLPWADHLVKRFGVARPAMWGETALQVCLHSTYHRGQVNARLRALGAEPPLTDFIAWIWMGRPAPAWPIDAV